MNVLLEIVDVCCSAGGDTDGADDEVKWDLVRGDLFPGWANNLCVFVKTTEKRIPLWKKKLKVLKK